MTLKDLSQLYYLKQEIEREQSRIDELRAWASSPPVPFITGMPGGGQHDSRIERYMAELDRLENMLRETIVRYIREKQALEAYIQGIDDSLTRQIFRLRFVDGLSWLQVSVQLGGQNTEDSVKKICYRYIKKQK